MRVSRGARRAISTFRWGRLLAALPREVSGEQCAISRAWPGAPGFTDHLTFLYAALNFFRVVLAVASRWVLAKECTQLERLSREHSSEFTLKPNGTSERGGLIFKTCSYSALSG